MQNIKDSSGKIYQRSEQTQLCYHQDTPQKVIEVIDKAFTDKARLKIYLGDAKTGRDWLELSDRFCRIGRSTGTFKIPLCIAKSNSLGGGGLLDHCIVKVVNVETGVVLYQHDKYKAPTIEVKVTEDKDYPFEVLANGEVQLRAKTEKSANIFKSKLS